MEGYGALVMNSWKGFLKRFIRPFTRLKKVRFVLYFFSIIGVFGALGAWISIIQISFGSGSIEALHFYRNLATYIISIAVTALADYLVREGDNGSDNGTFRLLLLIMTLLFAVSPAIVVFFTENHDYLWKLSVVGVAAAAWVWLSVHDSDPTLVPPDPRSTLGGPSPAE